MTHTKPLLLSTPTLIFLKETKKFCLQIKRNKTAQHQLQN